jgi:hypothetical protein
MNTRRTNVLAAALACLLCAWPGSANAQSPDLSAQTSAGGGPLILQPSGDGLVFAPDVKYARFGSGKGTLVGGYGGWLVDNTLLLGAGAYGLVDHKRSDPVSGMTYGGFVTGWTGGSDKPISAGLRGLVGFGRASITDTVTLTPGPGSRSSSGSDMRVSGPVRYKYRDDFFVFEPQANVLFRLARGIAVDVSAGYRIVQGAYDNKRLSGASGSVAFRFGPHF